MSTNDLWRTKRSFTDPKFTHIESDAVERIAVARTEEIASRIVACVNACAGIPDEKLKSWMNPPEGQLGAPHGTWAQQLVEVGKQMIQLQRERNELLDAMKKAVADLEKDGDEFGIASELSVAIAKAEAQS